MFMVACGVDSGRLATFVTFCVFRVLLSHYSGASLLFTQLPASYCEKCNLIVMDL